MPRGNPAVWSHYGSSYYELAPNSSKNGAAAPRVFSVDASENLRAAPVAGVPSRTRQRGAGSFVNQLDWSLATNGPSLSPGKRRGINTAQMPAPKATEVRSQYKPPPDDYQRRALINTNKDSFPVSNHPNDFKTVTKADFAGDPMRLPGFVKVQPVAHKDSGRLLPIDPVPPQYTTQATADFSGGRGQASVAARAAPRAGHPATRDTGFNIITGGPHAVANNVFERWDGRDYRRHR